MRFAGQRAQLAPLPVCATLLLICLPAGLSAAEPAGSAVCASCHARQARSHASTSMARTLARGSEAEILRSNPSLTYREGPYQYSIERGVYRVSNGKEAIAVPVAWAFGQGAAGQTYLFMRDGEWYESRVSFYRAIGGLGLTLGAPNTAPRNLAEAAGRRMTARDTVACFGCHSEGAVRESKLAVENISPGVQCESCHRGAARHAAAIKAGNTSAAGLPRLAKLTTDEISELCGRCHRTWADIAANGPMGVQNVRFQGYRLVNSKCYDAADSRISCIACHDPHQQLERKSQAYDIRCAACHASGAGARTCPTGKADCTGCHMPKYEIPGSHHSFSDHQIRVVRANEPYPN